MSDHYTYRITWSKDDREYVGLCLEFPSLSYLAKTQASALQGILALVKQIVDDMQENHETIPIPLADKNFSGKFQVRITPERHRDLAMKAAEARISLNRYINDKLAND